MKRHSASRRIFGSDTPSIQAALKIAGWLVLTVMVLAQARPAHAVVHSSIVVDAQTGRVLQDYHPDEQAHPASLTKLMTLYLTFQRLADGRMTLNQRLRVSPHAAAQQPAKLGLLPGTTVSVRTCILGIVSHSANDAAVVLAENEAGSEGQFAQLMNQQARQLGMTHTTFYNASGLPNARQWTTARDMATLALSIIQTFPQYYHYFDVHTFRYRGRTLYSFDHLPEEYPGADGMKTGYIQSSGFNIVTSAVRDHHRLIGVVFGGRTARARDLQMVALLNRGFSSLSHPTQLLAQAAVSQRPPDPRLTRRSSVTASPAAPSVRPVSSGSPDRVIQVGFGFRSPLQVRRILHSARLSAPPLLHHGRALVVRLRYGHYLARFADLSPETAFQACTALRARRFTCTVLQSVPQRAQNLAANDHGTTTLGK
jgi:D-alanyl-D-alanine carboxypeptidase